MKKLFILFEIVIVLFILTACRGNVPLGYPLTKWTGGGFELYVNQQKNGYLVFENSEEMMVFDVEFLYGNVLYIYKHRETSEQTPELVWEYFPVGINNEHKCAFSTANFKDENFSNIFPERLVFKKDCDITSEDIKYEVFEVGINTVNKTQGDCSSVS